ncbi:MAG: HipA N-terminal domain-containing protein [Verrucomicrobiales bacterium]
MRSGIVRVAGIRAGRIEETPKGFRFSYDPDYLTRNDAVAVSLTLPLQAEPFDSLHLFAFFEGLLSEGSLRSMQSRKYKIDEDDSFGFLLRTASADVIGNVTVESEEEKT